MPFNEADILREQVLRSQKIATIKRNIEVLSNNVTRLQGQDSPEDLLPARAQAIAVLNSKIAALEVELHELERKQRIQKALLERSRLEESKEDRGQKPPAGKAPAAETYLEADKTAGHANETISNSKLDHPKGKAALEEHCETSSEAKLARKKKMADLEAEVRVLSKIFERISAEMLELGEKGNGPKETSEAGQIPIAQIPLGTERAVSHPDDTAAKKRILKRLLLNPNSAAAIPIQVNKNANLTTTMHENELKKQVKKVTGEGTKATEKSKCNVQEKKPAGIVLASEAPVEVKNTAPHANETAPGGKILEPLAEPSNAQAIPTLASRDANLLAKTHEHKLREQIRKMTAERIKAGEESKCNVQEEKPAGKVPTSEYLIP